MQRAESGAVGGHSDIVGRRGGEKLRRGIRSPPLCRAMQRRVSWERSSARDLSTTARAHRVPAIMAPPKESGTRARVEIMGPGTYENAGKSQSVLIMIDPMISPRSRSLQAPPHLGRSGRPDGHQLRAASAARHCGRSPPRARPGCTLHVPACVRCVSTFLDKNRRYIGKSQPKTAA
eukprot:COSAG01_NODE_2027_length_8600_cov_3.986356_10_plen_177_part_00